MQDNFINMPCPHCHIPLQIPAQYLGQQGRCQHCQGQIVVYDPEAPAPTTAKKNKIKSCLIPFCILMFFFIIGFSGLMSSNEESSPQSGEHRAEQQTDFAYLEVSNPSIPGLTQEIFTTRWNEFTQGYGYSALHLSNYWRETGNKAMLPYLNHSQNVYRGGEITLQSVEQGIIGGWIEWNALELFNVRRGQHLDPTAFSSVDAGNHIAFSFGALAYALNPEFKLNDIETLMNRISPVLSDWEEDIPSFQVGNFEYEVYFNRIDHLGMVLESHYNPTN